MGNIGPQKMFALVVDKVTRAPRRLIDTSDDADDQHLVIAQKNVASDETIMLLPVADYPDRDPYVLAATLGYRPAAAVAVPPDDPAEKQAVLDIIPFISGLSQQFKAALAARIKELCPVDHFIILPRFDPKTRQLLAAELPPEMADKLTSDAPEAAFYVRTVAQALWSEISPR